MEIWNAFSKANKLKGQVLTIGITNQRETTILWNKKTGKTIYRAIVWQERRTEKFCKKLRAQNKETAFFNKTGLLSAVAILFKNNPSSGSCVTVISWSLPK